MNEELDEAVALLDEDLPGAFVLVRDDDRRRRRELLSALQARGLRTLGASLDAAFEPLQLRWERDGASATHQLSELPDRTTLHLVLAEARELTAKLPADQRPSLIVVAGLERILLDRPGAWDDQTFEQLNFSREALATFPFAIALAIPHWLYVPLLDRASDFLSWRRGDVDGGPPGDGVWPTLPWIPSERPLRAALTTPETSLGQLRRELAAMTSEAERAEAVGELEQTLAELGFHDEVIERTARALDDAPQSADRLLFRARALIAKGTFDEARACIAHAKTAARSAAQRRDALRHAVHLAVRAREPEREWSTEEARQLAAEAPDPTSRALLLREIGAFELGRGCPLDAYGTLSKSLDAAEQAGDPRVTAVIHGDLCAVNATLGRVAVAREALKAARACFSAAFRLDHPLAAALDALGPRLREEFGDARAPRPTFDAPPEGGDRCGRYELRELVGRGPLGTTWFARDEVSGADVVLRRFTTVWSTPGSEALFRERCVALARRRHPNLANLLDHGVEEREDGAHAFMVFEQVEGTTLYRVRGIQPMSLSRACELLLPVASALAMLHEEGIAHGELSTQHILVCADPRGPFARLLITAGTVAPVARATTSAELSWTFEGAAVERRSITATAEKKDDVRALALAFRALLDPDLPVDPLARVDLVRASALLLPLARDVRSIPTAVAATLDRALFEQRHLRDAGSFLEAMLDAIGDDAWAQRLRELVGTLRPRASSAPTVGVERYAVLLRLPPRLFARLENRSWCSTAADAHWAFFDAASAHGVWGFVMRECAPRADAVARRRLLMQRLGRRYRAMARLEVVLVDHHEIVDEVWRDLLAGPPLDGCELTAPRDAR